jgi:MFS transporter, FSR family, fosmidomycin resistance protein
MAIPSATSANACASHAAAKTRSRNLRAACLAHAVHDGFTDALYAFLPVWQAQFGLSYAGLAVLRGLYFGTMGGLQMPADRALRRLSPRAALILSTVVAATGLLIMALPLGFAGLCVGLVVAGIGSSIQHPRGSMLVTDSYGEAARRPLGIYNFAGDIGKAALPALAAVLLPILAWRSVVGLMAALGIAVALMLLSFTPKAVVTPGATATVVARGHGGGFPLLATIGALDTATRMGYLLFLPFLIYGRGGNRISVGVSGANSVTVMSKAVTASLITTLRTTPSRSPSQPHSALPKAPPTNSNASAIPTVGELPPRP